MMIFWSSIEASHVLMIRNTALPTSPVMVALSQAGVNPFHIGERISEEDTEFDKVVDLCMKAWYVKRAFSV